MNKLLSFSLIFIVSVSLHAMENNGKNPVYGNDKEVAAPAIELTHKNKSAKQHDSFIDNPADYSAPTAMPSGAHESNLQIINDCELPIKEKRERVFQLPFALSSGFDALKNDAQNIILKLMKETFNYELPVLHYAFSHDGKYCAISTYNDEDEANEYSSVHIIDLISMRKVYVDRYDSIVEQIEFSPNSQLLLIVCNDVEIINLPRFNLPGFSCTPINLEWNHRENLFTFSSDSQYLVISSHPHAHCLGQVVRLSDNTTMLPSEGIFTSKLSPDSKYLAIEFEEGRVQILDFPSMQILRTINDSESPVHSFAFDSESKHLAIAQGDSVNIIDLASMQIHTKLEYNDRAQWAEFSPDSKYLATIKGHRIDKYDRGTLQIIDCASMKALCSVEILVKYDDRNQRMDSFAFSPDSKYCATITQNGTAILIDLIHYKHSETLSQCKSVRFSPNSQYLAVRQGYIRQRSTMTVIDLASMDTIFTVPCDTLYDVTFSHDSKYCAATPYDKAFSIIEIQKFGNILNEMNLQEFELLKALDVTRSTALQYKSVLNLPQSVTKAIEKNKSESPENVYLSLIRMRIHATPAQWATWQTLKEKLPPTVQDTLMRVICNADQKRQALKRKNQTDEEQPSKKHKEE